MFEIDAKGVYYRELNEQIRAAIDAGEKDIVLKNINGQYYIGTGITKKLNITVEGVSG